MQGTGPLGRAQATGARQRIRPGPSFASLSLEPPLIMLCPSRTSTTWPKIREAGRFCVNVLAEHHRDVSDQFARSGTDKFAGVAWWEKRPGCRCWPAYAR